MIEARRLSVRRGGATLVDGISLSVAPGEIVALLGPNGAGKSTLLSALADGDGISAGEALWFGQPVGAWERRALARRRAALTQSPRLPFVFTAAEVALLGRWPHSGGHPSALDASLAAEALSVVGVGHLAQRPITALSGGEARRVHLARTLCQLWGDRPSLPPGRALLLDEPTSSLDPAQALSLMALLSTLRAEGAAILMVVHDLNLAAGVADRIALLRGGRLIACGRPAEALRPEALAACFDLRVAVRPHPAGDFPLIVPLGPIEAPPGAAPHPQSPGVLR